MACYVSFFHSSLRIRFTSHVFISFSFFFLMIRRPPRSTLDRSSAASDVYKRQILCLFSEIQAQVSLAPSALFIDEKSGIANLYISNRSTTTQEIIAVSYTHLRAHETVLDLVCRLLLEKKKNKS